MKPGYFFVLAIVLSIGAIIALRYNIQTVDKKRTSILQKDQSKQDVTQDIKDLKEFSLSHTQSSVQFELSASYERAVAKAEAEATDRETGKLYQKAQAACDRPGVSSVAQAQCVQNYVNARLQPSQNPAPFEPPNRSTYMYSFASPTWAPDVAGFFLMGALLSAFVALIIYLKHLIYFEHHRNH